MSLAAGHIIGHHTWAPGRKSDIGDPNLTDDRTGSSAVIAQGDTMPLTDQDKTDVAKAVVDELFNRPVQGVLSAPEPFARMLTQTRVDAANAGRVLVPSLLQQLLTTDDGLTKALAAVASAVKAHDAVTGDDEANVIAAVNAARDAIIAAGRPTPAAG